MKAMIWVGITIGGLIGGWIGSLLDHGNMLGLWGILFGAAGSLAGIWAAVHFGE
jgi:hypothetical protein